MIGSRPISLLQRPESSDQTTLRNTKDTPARTRYFAAPIRQNFFILVD
jgi:hypothetical protein